ncbi:patatin-like phospholipase family protein [Myxococcota bacterium]|nr:patatin-like phospholipase family protein [Myxococcota bacterium]MBU1900091.1 patatin-like phospholipase family protein [Myxococcota bacterium]
MPKCGLVLAGGGARGAYEAGVLYYLFVEAPSELREAARFEVLSGTSIGALNVATLAANLHQPTVGLRKLVDLWRGLDLETLLPLTTTSLVTLPRWFIGKNPRQSIFDVQPIWRLLNEAIDWERIHVNLNNGLGDAMTISCTQVPTGKTVVFYETADGRARKLNRDPHVRPIHARLTPQHILASASIPFVFPATLIDGIPYVDGGIRHNTPLSPALRLGSERLLAVGLGHEKRLEHENLMPDWRSRLKNPIFLMAKLLNSLMLEQVDYDLIRLEHINRLLSQGEAAFGESFSARLNDTLTPIRGAPYRKVQSVVLRPSQDIGRLAAEHARGPDFKGSGLISRFTRLLAKAEGGREADLTSYLLFDGRFCGKLIDLGVEDARRQHDDLMRLFTAPDERLPAH